MSPRQSAVWFGQLAALTRAGITIPAAVRQADGPPREAREKLALALESRAEPGEAWAATPFLAAPDAAVAAAGQRSGRFPDACAELALRHDAAAALRSKMLTASLYPVFLINFALFVSPFILAPDFSGNRAPALDAVLSRGFVLGATYVAAFWIVVLAVRTAAAKNPGARARVVRFLPLWSGAAKHAAYAVFAGTLASLLRAGIGIGEAWRFAGGASGDPGIAAFSRRVAATVENEKSPPGTLLASTRVFPEDFRSLYLAGEASGSLEARLDELRVRHAEEASSRATVAAFAYSKCLLIAVVLLVAAKIVTFYGALYSPSAIEKMMR